MYKKVDQCENWEDICNLINYLIKENEQLKLDKQMLTTTIVNLRLHNKKENEKRNFANLKLISES